MSREPSSVSFYTRLDTLKKRHAVLDRHIDRQQRNPATAGFYLKQLKRQKLLLKDQMETLAGQLSRKAANAH